MHPTLVGLSNELQLLATAVTAAMPNNEPLNVVHSNWSFPGLTREELVQRAKDIVELISARGTDTLGSHEVQLADFVRRLTFLRGNTVPQLWSNGGAAVPVYIATLDALERAITGAFNDLDPVDLDRQKAEALKTLQRVLRTLSAVEGRVSDASTRSSGLEEKLQRIEQAHDTAYQLPIDIQYLFEKRQEVERLVSGAGADRTAVGARLKEIQELQATLAQAENEAKAIIARCDKAYQATTTEGLASAFANKSFWLNFSMWAWVFGLIGALVFGAVVGGQQLENLVHAIRELKGSAAQSGVDIWLNLLLAVFSVGAPVWFAWLSTKQIGQRFRLAEDYGYKASLSKAYEGYRREAALLDPKFQNRLFDSALTHLDEIPLRLVESDSHGSPWHELSNSRVVRKAVDTIPGAVEKIAEFARRMVEDTARSSVQPNAASPIVGTPKPPTKTQ